MQESLRQVQLLLGDSHLNMLTGAAPGPQVGVMYGNPEVTSGGNALKFYSSVRVDVRKKDSITAEGSTEVVGIKARAKIVKNKVAGPYR